MCKVLHEDSSLIHWILIKMSVNIKALVPNDIIQVSINV